MLLDPRRTGIFQKISNPNWIPLQSEGLTLSAGYVTDEELELCQTISEANDPTTQKKKNNNNNREGLKTEPVQQVAQSPSREVLIGDDSSRR